MKKFLLSLFFIICVFGCSVSYATLASTITEGKYVLYSAGGLTSGWQVIKNNSGQLILANDTLITAFQNLEIPPSYTGMYEIRPVGEGTSDDVDSLLDGLNDYCNTTFGTGSIASGARSITDHEVESMFGYDSYYPGHQAEQASAPSENEFWVDGSSSRTINSGLSTETTVYGIYYTCPVEDDPALLSADVAYDGNSLFSSWMYEPYGDASYSKYVFPMVTVKSGLITKSGSGTRNDPYVLEDVTSSSFPVNAPVLGEGMVPYNNYHGGGVTDVANWLYDYNLSTAYEIDWAYAIAPDDGRKYYWIPRFSYLVEYDEIEGRSNFSVSLKYSNGTEDDLSDGYIAHPAFTFDGYELTGIWVVSDEISIISNDELINDAGAMLREAYYSNRALNSHLMNNTEWSATVYFIYAYRGIIPWGTDRGQVRVAAATDKEEYFGSFSDGLKYVEKISGEPPYSIGADKSESSVGEGILVRGATYGSPRRVLYNYGEPSELSQARCYLTVLAILPTQKHTLTVINDDASMSRSVEVNEAVTVSASASYGYEFDGWIEESPGGFLTAEQKKNSMLNFSMPDYDLILRATFKSTVSYCDCCSKESGTCSCSSIMCSVCGKCMIHCECNIHYCSFKVECPKTHCDILICVECGRHRNDAICGGGCNTDAQCGHCLFVYCSLCNNHSCTCNEFGYCDKPHCMNRVYCTLCGHSCDGDHKFGALVCTKVHCGDFVCTFTGCNVHQSGVCRGDHIDGLWFEDNGLHKRRCGFSGCSVILDEDTHNPVWGAADNMHTSVSKKCTLTYTHVAEWTKYNTINDKHVRYCTVFTDGSICPAIDSHDPIWSSEFVKADHGDESSGAEHIRYCTFNGCDLVTDRHSWSDDVKWHPVDANKHERVCPTCGLKQVLLHNFLNWEVIPDNIENHYKVCAVCVDDNDVSYKLLEKHVDEDYSGRGNGICDWCSKELWKVSISNTNPTNHDIKVRVEVFSDYNDRVELPIKMIDLYDNEFYEDDGWYVIGENGDYTFVCETPDVNVVVHIGNISKDIYGRIFVTPDTATTGDVTLKLVVSNEGVDKTIDLKFENRDWNNDVLELSEVVTNNGVYEFYARDSLGNTKTFSVNVNNIVSGFGSVTTTYDTFVNGYVFTDIMVNCSEIPSIDGKLTDALEPLVYKYKVNGNGIKVPVTVNKLYIVDEAGNTISDEKALSSGVFYLRVAIGGAEVFNEVGTYMVEVENVTVKNVILEGKNRIEVVIQSLNDLT